VCSYTVADIAGSSMCVWQYSKRCVNMAALVVESAALSPLTSSTCIATTLSYSALLNKGCVCISTLSI
jgi:hypothetical protein